MNSSQNTPRFHHRPLGLALTLLAILMLPLVYYFAWESPDWPTLLKLTVASAALVGALLLVGKICCLKLPRSTALLVGLILIALLVLRFFYVLLLDFSGNGFTSEVFIHTEWNAVKIGAREYALPLLGLAGLVVGLFVWIVRHPFWRPPQHPRMRRPRGGMRAILLTTGLGALAIAALFRFGNVLPASEFIQAWHDYASPSGDGLLFDAKSSDESIRKALHWLEPIRGHKPLPTPKDRLQVNASADSPNLILVYLESFNDMFTENPDFPGLTPNLDALKKRFTVLNNNYSSAYVTIEGMANSQCGTLMNMQFSNNSLTTPSGRLPGMACLGDILKQAGYAQTFLGGAKSEFAGKGDFFTDHGYDRVLGWKHWEKQGFSKEGWWGLADTRLFEQALKIIEDYRQANKRYNVTLLTLGTHLPGFPYSGCPKYEPRPEERLLNAIHCTDYLLGKFIQSLDEKGVLEDTVLYIQGDHGIFMSPEPTRLFGKKKVQDQRILTLVSLPKNAARAPLRNGANERISAETSTYDTVANLLHWLKIQHNTAFVLADTLSASLQKPRYLLSRGGDHYQGSTIGNSNLKGCSDTTGAGQPNLPLSACNKRTTLKTIYAINALYTRQQEPLPVCEKGLVIAKNAKGRLIQVKWGGKDISATFRHKGFPVSTATPGAILLLLDKRGHLLNQMQFDLREDNDLKDLQRYLQAMPAGTTFILARNVKNENVPEAAVKKWPDLLRKHTFVAGAITEAANTAASIQIKDPSGFRILASNSSLSFSYRIYPESCHKTIETDIKVNQPSPARFCPIKKWGPQQTFLGQPFNVIKDGRSAFWLETECAPDYPEIHLDGQPIQTQKRLPIITAALEATKVINKPGRHKLELVDGASGESRFIGNFLVINPAHLPEKPKKKKKNRQNTTARFCPIKKWGPKKLTAGMPFNQQPDGSSAFWLVTDCAPPGAVAYLGGRPLKTVGGPPQLAALVAPGTEPTRPGTFTFSLKDPSSGKKLEIGTVRVYSKQEE